LKCNEKETGLHGISLFFYLKAAFKSILHMEPKIFSVRLKWLFILSGISLALLLSPGFTLADPETNDNSVSTDQLNQLDINSNIGKAEQELNMEETGITGIADTGVISASPGDTTEIQGTALINSEQNYKLKLYWSHIVQDDYSPALQRDLSTWKENIQQVQLSKSLGKGKTVSAGWLEGKINQENHYYNDTDFSLERKVPFLHVQLPVSRQIFTAFRIRPERITNDSNSGYFKLDKPQNIVTGYMLLNYTQEKFWLNLNYSRERESDPIYDPVEERAILNIEMKELAGGSVGTYLTDNTELGASLYYETYGSNRKNQFNANLQISGYPDWMDGVRLSLGTGYYTEEKETIVNLAAGYNWQPLPKLTLGMEYQLEYSHNEESWLNQGELVMSWSVLDRLSLIIKTSYGKEIGEDQDEFFSIQAGPSLTFF